MEYLPPISVMGAGAMPTLTVRQTAVIATTMTVKITYASPIIILVARHKVEIQRVVQLQTMVLTLVIFAMVDGATIIHNAPLAAVSIIFALLITHRA